MNMRSATSVMAAALAAAALSLPVLAGAEAGAPGYRFKGGYPNARTVQRGYDEADLNRAVQAYRFFYPSVSGIALFKGMRAAGVLDNKVFGVLDAKPQHVGFTLNSDTPYAPVLLDLTAGPISIEIPPGPLVVVTIDIHQRWVADMGLPGVDAGNGGKHLIVPATYKGKLPAGYHVHRAYANHVMVAVRSIPTDGNVEAAVARIKTIKVRPLNAPAGFTDPEWPDLTAKSQDTTPLKYERTIDYWKVLHEVLDTEPVLNSHRAYYGELAALGIVTGKPFAPDARMTKILERAAQLGNAQMRVQAFADRRPDRVVWPDRKWEWAGLRPENGGFSTPSYTDLDARELWFYQAIVASPAMFRRDPKAGSLYWLGVRDSSGTYLDGGKSYKLTVPQPVPGKLFWSVTVYDAETRSQISTDQGKAALRSLFELKDIAGAPTAELYFGPKAPPGKEGQWIKTIPGKGWFAYIRIYGPEAPAFDGSWKPGDFEKLKK